MRKSLYEVGDYVKYGGDYSTLDETRREKGFAKILNIKKFDYYWLVGLELVKSKDKISCVIDRIRPIDTSEKCLKEIGFEGEIDNAGKKAYVMNDIIISSMCINILHKYSKSVFISGFCIADFRNNEMIDFEKYKEDDFINAQKFYSDFKNVNNLNDLLNYLESEKGIDIDKEKIISLI
ncbi:hypothetical protein [Cellulophaga sp. L1A9]|uniref:hypothetical protein n=1 Tax=Cellulophaga sp. L1A9 TaxID=2686362 RepID=UPI00131BEB47|nr:hypothetical protein [Cellulophaga sp. L1A9]